MTKLKADYLELDSEIDKLIDLLSQIDSLQPRFAKLVAEILLLRLFSSLEEIIVSVAIKIGCGSLYIDGSMPILFVQSKSRQGAIDNMTKYRRKKPRYLRWSPIKEIRKNVEYVIDPDEHFLKELDIYNSFIEEMRWVRNRIAHNNTTARANYRKAILRYYGGYVNSVTPGTLLLSPKQNPVLIEQYLRKSRILVKTLVKG